MVMLVHVIDMTAAAVPCEVARYLGVAAAGVVKTSAAIPVTLTTKKAHAICTWACTKTLLDKARMGTGSERLDVGACTVQTNRLLILEGLLTPLRNASLRTL